ncbi:trace amine-associated receptor 1-like [Pygocentrus nattereri]|uniref:trace amine-associated receptor 1-like n=1 Tax=Pygocentrus nattereri TaxID=42514 RepID=UPI0008142985|nr:trace amine-associated receptor 1-like [Pygocentrus nattereri]
MSLCYEHHPNSCQKHVYLLAIRVLAFFVIGVIILVTLFGNLVVIIAITHFKQLHTPTNYLILSLAVADLLVGGVVMPPSMLRSVESCWYLGTLFYRYYAVCHPLLYHSIMTPNATAFMIVVCWTVSAFVGFGMIFLELGILGVEDYYYSNVACEGGCILFLSKTASSVFTMLCFYIPAVIMIGLYLKVFHIAQRQARLIQHGQMKSSQRGTAVGKTEIKATKTLAVIVGVFLLFWSPYFICALIDPYIQHTVPSVLFDFFAWIGYFNSTCNPLVYAFFYSWFRKSLRIILLGKIFKQNSFRIKLF